MASASKGRMDDRDLLNLVNAHERSAMGSSVGAANIATSGTTTQYGAVDVERAQALDYYHGRPLGNEVVGRSQVVSQELRDTVEWAMPQIMRMFVSSKDIVRFEPENPNDEQQSQQATDAVNYLLMQQNNGVILLHDFFKDALILKNGYIKVWFEEVERESFESYTGLDDATLTFVIQQIEQRGEDAEIVAQEEKQGFVPDPMTGQLVPNVTFDVRIKCTRKEGRYVAECIPTEDMRISPQTTHDLQQSPFVAHVVRKTRSQWKELGYDVDDEPADKGPRIGIQDIARSDSMDELSSDDAGIDKSMEIVEGLEGYMRVDYDGDGYAELRHFLKAPGKIVENEPIEEIPIAHCVPIRMPHRHLGISYFDLLKDLQDIKTTLIRQTLDNVYRINQGRLAVNVSTVNLEDLSVSQPGGFVRVDGPTEGQIQAIDMPSIAGELLPIINYTDEMKAQRTGISATTSGLDPDTLQETTAKAYTNAMNAATAKVELICRMLAEGVKDAAILMHNLLIRHQDKPMMLKLRNNWVPIDPTSWRKRYSCTVNVGLGTGSRDEMRGNLMLIGQMQQQAAQVGIVQPQNVYALVSEMAEILGFPVPGKYFTDPSSPAFQQAMQQRQQQPPNPAVQVAQIRGQSDIQKAQISAQSYLAQIQAEARMHSMDMLNKMAIEKQRTDAALAKAQADGNASNVAAYLNHAQKHNEAIMQFIQGMAQTDSRERQNFVNALGATAGAAHGQ